MKTTRGRQREELRQAIIDEAEMLLGADGRETLTMRKLAARLGCTPMAIYSYFDDKQALEHAIAARAFTALADRITNAVKNKTGVAAIHAGLMAYIAAAREDPEHYRTLFMTPIPPEWADKTHQELTQEHPAFRLLYENVSGCVDAGELLGDPFALTTVLWTTAHGTAAALITFIRFPFGNWETYACTMIDTVLEGARHRAVDKF
jgi:AcrR family transcriptional regulator